MRLILTMLMALSLSACSTFAPAPPPAGGVANYTTPVVDAALIQGTRGLILAENTYTVIAANAARGFRLGLLPESLKPLALSLNRQITAGLDAGLSAKSGAEKLRQVEVINNLIARFRTLTPERD